MLLIHCVLCIIFTTSVRSVENSQVDLKNGQQIHTEVIKELVRRIEENGLRMKDFEDRTTKQMETMQLKLKQQEIEILALRESKCTVSDINDERTKQIEDIIVENVRHKKDADPGISRRADTDVRVAFSALLSADAHHLGLNQNVAFDNVLVNEGNAYNPHDGLFVAPYTGTYVFSTTVTIKEREATHFGFAKNGNVLTTIFVNGVEKWYDSSAQTIVLHLQVGDDVSVKHTESDKTLTGASHSLFSGFLLYRSLSDESIVG